MVVPTFGQPQKGVNYTTRPGAYAILRDDRSWIALVQTSYGYFLPGGGADGNETIEEALHREVFEEIGFRLTNLKKVGEAKQYVISRFYNQGFCKHGYFFLADWTQDPAGKVQEGHALVWLKPENALSAVSHEFQKWILQKHI